MAKITTAVCASVRAALARSHYDADTMQISRRGMVTALRDADKTFNAPERARIFIGDVDYVLTEFAPRAGA